MYFDLLGDDDLFVPKEGTNDLADQAESLSGEFAKLDCISQGSPKQIKWASDIFANKACDYYARRVLDGALSRENAEKALKNSSAKWWIDNRGVF